MLVISRNSNQGEPIDSFKAVKRGTNTSREKIFGGYSGHGGGRVERCNLWHPRKELLIMPHQQG